MDRSAKPGDDFYKFANGTWDANTAIPSDRTRYGNFDKLAELSEARTKAIITEAASAKSPDADTVKIGAAYKAFMVARAGEDFYRHKDGTPYPSKA